MKQLDDYFADPLTTNPSDPANARYVVPLEDPEQEKMAHSMADSIYSAVAEDYFTDSTTKEQADRVLEQCLIDSRHMLCDEAYMKIFGGGDEVEIDEPLEHPEGLQEAVRKAMELELE